MSRIRILHAADLHLDSPFEGLPAAKAAQRRQEQRELLKKMANTAETEQVQLVLLSGDLLDSDSAYTETAEELVRALGSMSVPVIISPGNHDFYSRRSPYARLTFPKNVYLFTENRIQCVELAQLGVRVWGAAFTDKYSPALLSGFSAEKKNGVLDLMCIHGEVGKGTQYNPITTQDIAASNMDYIALGHIHQASGLNKAGNTYYAWPGCPEGRGFDECGEKGFVLLDITDQRITSEFIPFAKRKLHDIPVDITNKTTISEIQQAMSTAASDVPREDLVKFTLKGSYTLETQKDFRFLQQILESNYYFVKIKDESHLELAKESYENDISLKGEFIRMVMGSELSGEEKDKVICAGIQALSGETITF